MLPEDALATAATRCASAYLMAAPFMAAALRELCATSSLRVLVRPTPLLFPTVNIVHCSAISAFLAASISYRAALMLAQQFLQTVSNTHPILIAMASNALQTYVSVLDGSNYAIWADQMKAYLQSQEVWIMVLGTFEQPTLASNRSNATEVFQWMQNDEKAQGIIRLRLSPQILLMMKDQTTSKGLWQEIKDIYGTSSAANIFADFKKAVNTRVPGDKHPAASIASIQSCFDNLKANKIELPDSLKTMIVLNALPQRYDSVVQVYLNRYASRRHRHRRSGPPQGQPSSRAVSLHSHSPRPCTPMAYGTVRSVRARPV